MFPQMNFRWLPMPVARLIISPLGLFLAFSSGLIGGYALGIPLAMWVNFLAQSLPYAIELPIRLLCMLFAFCCGPLLAVTHMKIWHAIDDSLYVRKREIARNALRAEEEIPETN